MDARWLDSSPSRAGVLVVAAIACASMGRRDLRLARAQPDGAPASHLWPQFWFMTSVLVVMIAVGRLLGVGELVSEAGRQESQASGWYEVRRPVQAAAVALVATVWVATVAWTIVRFPIRRRRFIAPSVVVTTMLCFVAVRLVSLHHVDTVLYRTDIAGARVVAYVDVALAAALVVVVAVSRFGRSNADMTAEVATSSTSR
jgi:magnesium-transporting ATPase (P-type)